MNSPPTMKVSTNALTNIDEALKTEWLVTNGLGGYSSSTILGTNTRKYHGLLVAALSPPVNRHVLLAKLDEEIQLSDRSFHLSVNETRSGIDLSNEAHPAEFSLEPLPTYIYNLGKQFKLKKTVFMLHKVNASVILYEAANDSGKTVRVSVAPLINFRHFHSVTPKNQVKWNIGQDNANHLVIAQPSSDSTTLAVFSPDGRFKAGAGEWVEAFYRAEAERGESNTDNNFKPGFFEFEVPPDEIKRLPILAVGGKDKNTVEDILWTAYKGPNSFALLYESELKRRRDALGDFQKLYSGLEVEDWLKWLVLAADDFIVKRESTNTKSVIAGYHWFADWGRDSLISLPGLTLVLRKFEEAKQILRTFSTYCREGLVPNTFPDNPQATPAYNTVDATLWFFNAILQYLKYTGDFEFVQKELWRTLVSIIDGHVNGTLFGIRVDEDGLLAHGAQLTWMDAAPDGRPVTPRNGKAVEIQALWYNALRIMQMLAHRFRESPKADQYLKIAEKAQKSFLEKFWNQERNCLIDVLNGDNRDSSLRPNQILAVSVDFRMLDDIRAELVVESVWRQLLTPFGLRTLVSSDPRYVGRYGGNMWQRDTAYHNGTVWPWLLGPFTTAFLRLRGYDPHWRSIAFEDFLKPLFSVNLHHACLGSISEILDGDPPHEAKGCVAQAWSVAEPLRTYVEDVLLKRPPYEKKIMEFNH